MGSSNKKSSDICESLLNKIMNNLVQDNIKCQPIISINTLGMIYQGSMAKVNGKSRIKTAGLLYNLVNQNDVYMCN